MYLNIEFLNYIYQNARNCILNINNLIVHIDDENLKKLLVASLKDYEKICEKAINYYIKLGNKEKDINIISKVNKYLSINIKLLINKSNTYIANILYKCFSKGIQDITSNINKYSDCDELLIELGNNLLNIEEKNIKRLKNYL